MENCYGTLLFRFYLFITSVKHSKLLSFLKLHWNAIKELLKHHAKVNNAPPPPHTTYCIWIWSTGFLNNFNIFQTRQQKQRFLFGLFQYWSSKKYINTYALSKQYWWHINKNTLIIILKWQNTANLKTFLLHIT